MGLTISDPLFEAIFSAMPRRLRKVASIADVRAMAAAAVELQSRELRAKLIPLAQQWETASAYQNEQMEHAAELAAALNIDLELEP